MSTPGGIKVFNFLIQLRCLECKLLLLLLKETPWMYKLDKEWLGLWKWINMLFNGFVWKEFNNWVYIRYNEMWEKQTEIGPQRLQ